MNLPAEHRDAVVNAMPRALPAGEGQPAAVIVAAPPRGLRRLVGGTVVPYLSRQVQGVGHAGTAGVALLVFAAAFFFGANSPLRGELAGLQSTLDAAEQGQTHAPGATAAPQSELHAFMKRLPARSELPALTNQIVALATASGIALERGTYDFTVTHSGQLVRARLSFPVHGRYPDVRRFIDATLATIPGAAVDALRFERKEIGDAEIDADIRFALYLRGAP